jgi:hypothetical protein
MKSLTNGRPPCGFSASNVQMCVSRVNEIWAGYVQLHACMITALTAHAVQRAGGAYFLSISTLYNVGRQYKVLYHEVIIGCWRKKSPDLAFDECHSVFTIICVHAGCSKLKARRWVEKGPLPQARNCQFRELPQIFQAPQQMSYTALTIQTPTDLMAYWNSLYPG